MVSSVNSCNICNAEEFLLEMLFHNGWIVMMELVMLMGLVVMKVLVFMVSDRYGDNDGGGGSGNVGRWWW